MGNEKMNPKADQTHSEVSQSEVAELESHQSSSSNSESFISNGSPENHGSTFYKSSFFARNFTVLYETKEERTFVRKLDLLLLTWGCVSYCIKNIDQTNYKHAYVSGMADDLHMSEDNDDYNLLNTLFMCGYLIGIIPFQILMNSVLSASVVLSGCELLWGICTFLCAVPQDSVRLLFGLRFLIGFFESCSWSGITFVLFNYYTPRELSFRGGLIMVSTQCGRAFTGFMQAAIYKNMDNTHGIQGWRWLFIINGAITVVVALLGFVIIPDTPDNGGAWWMSPGEVAIARGRMASLGRRTARKFEWRKYLEPFLDYKFYLITLAYSGWDLGASSTGYITLWLKSLTKGDGSPKYTVEQVNLIPGGCYLLAALSIVVVTRYADISQKRIHALVFQQVSGIIGCSILAAWPHPMAAKYVGFLIMFTVQSTGAITTSFIPEVWARKPEMRSTIIVTIVIFTYIMNAWLTLVIWPVKEAPNYKYGYKVCLGFEVMSLVGCILFYFLVYKRLRDRGQLESQQELDDSSVKERKAEMVC